MPLELKPATLSDAPEIAAIMQQVSSTPRITLEFQNCVREEVLRWNLECVKVELEGVGKVGGEAEAWKVVDVLEGGEGERGGEVIAGFGVWGFSERADDLVLNSKTSLPLPADTNLALRRTFTSTLQAMEEKYRPKGPYFELLELITAVDYQRRGIGSRLVNIGLEKADKEGVDVYLSGSPMGVPVYRKLGFEEVGRLEIPLGEFGGKEGEVHVHVAMIRKPRKVET